MGVALETKKGDTVPRSVSFKAPVAVFINNFDLFIFGIKIILIFVV
jgi:hypothetical protein